MSEHDKMMAFGHWLTNRVEQQRIELFSLSINRKAPIDAIRIKAGHIEDSVAILSVFTELYKGDLNKFNVDYLGAKPEKEEEKESADGPDV
jgi:hypothetical protein